MFSVAANTLPDHALLAKYKGKGAFTDCYTTRFAGEASLAQFVTAFYTSWLFKLERWILGWAVAKPSSDQQAAQVAAGTVSEFAAWTVEGRSATQLLMCDLNGRTRSWFMVEQENGSSGLSTLLYFGSAVVLHRSDPEHKGGGFIFRALLGFHKLYSVFLVRLACHRL